MSQTLKSSSIIKRPFGLYHLAFSLHAMRLVQTILGLTILLLHYQSTFRKLKIRIQRERRLFHFNRNNVNYTSKTLVCSRSKIENRVCEKEINVICVNAKPRDAVHSSKSMSGPNPPGLLWQCAQMPHR